jgi:hypothetical protein
MSSFYLLLVLLKILPPECHSLISEMLLTNFVMRAIDSDAATQPQFQWRWHAHIFVIIFTFKQGMWTRINTYFFRQSVLGWHYLEWDFVNIIYMYHCFSVMRFVHCTDVAIQRWIFSHFTTSSRCRINTLSKSAISDVAKMFGKKCPQNEYKYDASRVEMRALWDSSASLAICSALSRSDDGFVAMW